MSSFSDWEKQFDKQGQEVLEAAKKIQLEAAKMLLERIIELTPVGNPLLWNPPYWPKDYTPGQLRDSWELSTSNSLRNNATGRFTTADVFLSNYGIQTKINNISISNRQPYAYRVEYLGWSHLQRPEGMMRVANMQWDSFVEQASKKNKI